MSSVTRASATPPSLSERIADGIVEIIHAEHLAPGDALASSRSLAERFQVTTPTVREALRRLEALDVVQFRHGSGTYVGQGLSRRVLGNPHSPAPNLRSTLELAQARLVIEPSIAAEAARRRSAEALTLLEASSKHALNPQEGSARPDLPFHVALARATGNPLLAETVESLLAVRALDQVEIRRRYDDRDQDHSEHRQILEAVRDGDASVAETLTREHLSNIRDAIARAVDQEAGA
ncbi:FadR/GntR family transcriptional regulator [Dermacoccaceae bacterium W4C1]